MAIVGVVNAAPNKPASNQRFIAFFLMVVSVVDEDNAARSGKEPAWVGSTRPAATADPAEPGVVAMIADGDETAFP